MRIKALLAIHLFFFCSSASGIDMRNISTFSHRLYDDGRNVIIAEEVAVVGIGGGVSLIPKAAWESWPDSSLFGGGLGVVYVFVPGMYGELSYGLSSLSGGEAESTESEQPAVVHSFAASFSIERAALLIIMAFRGKVVSGGGVVTAEKDDLYAIASSVKYALSESFSLWGRYEAALFPEDYVHIDHSLWIEGEYRIGSFGIKSGGTFTATGAYGEPAYPEFTWSGLGGCAWHISPKAVLSYLVEYSVNSYDRYLMQGLVVDIRF